MKGRGPGKIPWRAKSGRRTVGYRPLISHFFKNEHINHYFCGVIYHIALLYPVYTWHNRTVSVQLYLCSF